jgi:hypothetical protein
LIFYYPLDKEGYSKYDMDQLRIMAERVRNVAPDELRFILLPEDIGHRFIQDKNLYIKILKDYIKSLEEQPDE